MALLTETTFKQFFDVKRIEDLASTNNAAVGEMIFDSSILSAIFAQVDDTIYNQLANQYTTAEVDANKALERHAANIAMYYLESRRGDTTEMTVRHYQSALDYLKSIVDGVVRLANVSQLLPIHAVPTREDEESMQIHQSGYFTGFGGIENE